MNIKRFNAIEGLRAYLAWAVVLDHIAWWSGFRGPVGELLRDLGTPAVETFMIVSGCVITHLLLERPEPYRYYLTRRFARIFPLFAVSCVLGYFVYRLPLLVPGFDTEFAAELRTVVADSEQYFWAHVVAHGTMLHGVVSNDVLPSSQYAFNMMAWTISLEWQFYLLAPFIISVLLPRSRGFTGQLVQSWRLFKVSSPFAGVLALIVLFYVTRWLFKHHWFGVYSQLSLLPGMGEFFATGIACRLLYPHIAGRIDWPVALAGVMVFFMLTRHHVLTLWLAVYFGLLLERSPILYQLAFESPLIKYLGSRSYSTFLGHFIVVNVAVWLWYVWTGTVPGFIPLLMMTIPATVILAEFTYRWIELPGIALGSYCCKPPAVLQLVEVKCRSGSS